MEFYSIYEKNPTTQRHKQTNEMYLLFYTPSTSYVLGALYYNSTSR